MHKIKEARLKTLYELVKNYPDNTVIIIVYKLNLKVMNI